MTELKFIEYVQKKFGDHLSVRIYMNAKFKYYTCDVTSPRYQSHLFVLPELERIIKYFNLRFYIYKFNGSSHFPDEIRRWKNKYVTLTVTVPS